MKHDKMIPMVNGGLTFQPPRSPSFSLLAHLAILLLLPISISPACNPSDHESLLTFYNSISVSSASYSSTDCCSWEGVLCNSEGRVVNLTLPSKGLTGKIPLSLTNLTYLSYLNLSHNQLPGPLPFELFSMNQLRVLDLSNNLISGQLPSPSSSGNFINNSVIEILDLSRNQLSGPISPMFIQQIGKSGSLTSFNLSDNLLEGLVPVSFCPETDSNSYSLRLLDLSYNDFTGQIGTGLGNCLNLTVFKAGFNNLTGQIPDDIFAAWNLEILSLPLNHISGNIRDDIIRLTRLKSLELYSNTLTGSIPEKIGQLSGLEQLLLHINNLTGTLPGSLTNCTILTVLNLRVNALTGDISTFDFSKIVKLTTLDLGNNGFSGSLPSSLYSCKSLTALRLAGNQIGGEISPNISMLQSLSFLSLSNNKLQNLSRAITSLLDCKNLGTLVLSGNFLNEALPNGNTIVGPESFQNIQVLSFGASKLTGQVPSWIVDLKKLEVLDLSYNKLTGSIPHWLGDLPSLFYLDLSNNHISGQFPVKLCNLSALMTKQVLDPANQSYLALPVFVAPNNASNQQYNQLSSLPPAIYLGNNTISGKIPEEIGQLKIIQVLDLSRNNFSGGIPDSISNLSNLEILDLSGNCLTGEIPSSLGGLHFLSSFSVANNDLQGPIPTGGQFDTFPNSSFAGNPGLCGIQVLQHSCSNQTLPTSRSTVSHKSSSKKLVIGLAFGISLGVTFIAIMLACWILSKRRIIPRGDTEKIDLDTDSYASDFDNNLDQSLVILFRNNSHNLKELTMSDILKATDNFNQENIVGCGGFGLVYKATLENGTKMAVKKLSGDLGMMEREFTAEVEALSAAQHDNLVSLQGYCIHDGSRLLMYSYMENGSLDYWLHEKTDGPSQLDWPNRLKILQGASSGLAYMHQICEPHIVHRDIKSSNILLDHNFEAHIADFGLSRLIDPYQTHVTTELVGTLGYIPPEYGQAWVATLRGDVYSFGVVMLELLTGKRPVDISKPRMSRDLVEWVGRMRNEKREDEVFDLVLRGKGFEEEMIRVLDVACLCVNRNPVKRPTIKEVVDWLNNVGVKDGNQD